MAGFSRAMGRALKGLFQARRKGVLGLTQILDHISNQHIIPFGQQPGLLRQPQTTGFSSIENILLPLKYSHRHCTFIYTCGDYQRTKPPNPRRQRTAISKPPSLFKTLFSAQLVATAVLLVHIYIWCTDFKLRQKYYTPADPHSSKLEPWLLATPHFTPAPEFCLGLVTILQSSIYKENPPDT